LTIVQKKVQLVTLD